MTYKLRFYVIVTTLALSLPAYLMLMALGGDNSLFMRIARLPAGLFAVLATLIVFSWAVSAVLDISLILKRMFFKPKLGEILVSEGYITEKELRRALSQQGLKIGQVLVRAGRITADQLNQALEIQQKQSGKIGEILKDLEFAQDEDINWALAKMKKKVGTVLLEMGLLTDHDVDRALKIQRKPRKKSTTEQPAI
jgi:hypothetical protein